MAFPRTSPGATPRVHGPGLGHLTSLKILTVRTRVSCKSGDDDRTLKLFRPSIVKAQPQKLWHVRTHRRSCVRTGSAWLSLGYSWGLWSFSRPGSQLIAAACGVPIPDCCASVRPRALARLLAAGHEQTLVAGHSHSSRCWERPARHYPSQEARSGRRERQVQIAAQLRNDLNGAESSKMSDTVTDPAELHPQQFIPPLIVQSLKVCFRVRACYL